MPPSLAKANVRRDTDAKSAKPEAKAMMIRPASMAVAAALEPVAARKMAMIGKPVGVLRTSVMFPRQKRRAIRKPKARTPLMMMVRMMTLGTVDAESLTWNEALAIRAEAVNLEEELALLQTCGWRRQSL